MTSDEAARWSSSSPPRGRARAWEPVPRSGRSRRRPRAREGTRHARFGSAGLSVAASWKALWASNDFGVWATLASRFRADGSRRSRPAWASEALGGAMHPEVVGPRGIGTGVVGLSLRARIAVIQAAPEGGWRRDESGQEGVGLGPCHRPDKERLSSSPLLGGDGVEVGRDSVRLDPSGASRAPRLRLASRRAGGGAVAGHIGVDLLTPDRGHSNESGRRPQQGSAPGAPIPSTRAPRTPGDRLELGAVACGGPSRGRASRRTGPARPVDEAEGDRQGPWGRCDGPARPGCSRRRGDGPARRDWSPRRAARPSARRR